MQRTNRVGWQGILAAASVLTAPIVWGQDAEVVEAPALTPGGDEAVVFFVRARRVGGAINFFAFVVVMPVGVTRARVYTGAVVPAGERVVWARSGNVSAVKLNLEAGKTYYFDQEVRMGGLRARVRLVQLSEEEGRSETEGLDFKQLTDEGRERAQEIIAADYAEALAVAAGGGEDGEDEGEYN